MWFVAIIIIVAIVIFVIKKKAKQESNNQDASNTGAQESLSNQEAISKKQEERRKQEEAKRFDPKDKPLEWFGSEDGLKTFGDYMTAQNYFLEDTIVKEKEEKYEKYDLDTVIKVIHKEAKVPYTYFNALIKNIEAQPLDYVGPSELLISILKMQAKPFIIDDDGEPQPHVNPITPAEIVSVEKNPVLNYISNFKCYELKDDAMGAWKEKWDLLSSIMIWLGVHGMDDKEIVANNSWIFAKETYLNDMGTVRKVKGFYKKCIELTPAYKEYFENKLNECE